MRNEEVGKRLAQFKQGGGLNSDGSLNWKKGVYNLRFEGSDADSKLVAVRHINGDEVQVTKTCIDRSWGVSQNWSDWDASFEHDGMRPSPVWHLFKGTGLGPYKFPKVTGENKSFSDELSAAGQEWKKQKTEQASKKDEVVEVGKAFKEMQTEKAQQSLQAAREKARVAASQVCKRRTLTCQKSDG